MTAEESPEALRAENLALREFLKNALPYAYLPCDQTVQCPECNAIWWSCPEDIDEDWHGAGCRLHAARVMVGESRDVRRRDASEPDKPYNPNGPNPDRRSPSEILRDTVLDGWFEWLALDRYRNPPPEGMDPEVWKGAVGEVLRRLVVRARPSRGAYSDGVDFPSPEGDTGEAVREDRVLPETALVARVREEREAADALPNASLDNYAAAERAIADARAATDAALAAAGGAS